MNAPQYTNEILNVHLLPFMETLPGSFKDYETIEDGNTAHTSGLAATWRKSHNIKKSDWPPNSPDLNVIENCWPMLKARMKKRMRNPERRPHSEEELAEQAKEE